MRWRRKGNEGKGKWSPVVRTGLPPTKERYCSMVSLDGVNTGKSDIQREREKRRKEREIQYFYH